MTIPDVSESPAVPNAREPPWEHGWGPLHTAVLSPMMCSRSATQPRASTKQYHLQALIYQYKRSDGDFDWHGCSYAQIRARILSLMPPELRCHYQRILGGGKLPWPQEREMTPLVEWFHAQGPTLGFRIPTNHERTRATGRPNYLMALGLNEVQLFNAVGNHFDPDALLARIQAPLQWAAVRQSERHTYPAPADLAVMYRSLADQVSRRGIPVAPSPFPADLSRRLSAATGPPPRQEGHPWALAQEGSNLAAEHGRRGE